MNNLVKGLALLALMASCGPISIYHKAGVPVVRWQSDQDTCIVSAYRDAPIANQVRQTPPVFIPPARTCDAAGNCTTRAGFWRPGQVYTVDINAPVRKRLETRCMAAKGYSEVDIARCPAGTRVSGPTTVLPSLQPSSCVVKLESGQIAIVAPN